MAKQRSLNAEFRWAKEGEAGYIKRGSGSGKAGEGKHFSDLVEGVVDVIPLLDKREEEEETKDMESAVYEYMGEVGLKERLEKDAGTKPERTTESGMKVSNASNNSNTTLNKLITRVVENPAVSEKLQDFKEEYGISWFEDKDCIQTIARLILKNYSNFNFEERTVILAIKELYG